MHACTVYGRRFSPANTVFEYPARSFTWGPTFLLDSQYLLASYVDFDSEMEQCRENGLPELEKRLHSLKRTLEGLVPEAQSSHVEPRLRKRDTVSVRNESTPSRGIPSRDQSPILPGGPIFNGSIEAEDTNEMDLDSDVAGSGDSVTSRESCPIQRNLRSVPLSHCAKDATSSRQSGCDIMSSCINGLSLFQRTIFGSRILKGSPVYLCSLPERFKGIDEHRETEGVPLP